MLNYVIILFYFNSRLHCVSPKAESPPLQSSTQYGEDKRYYNDDILFKVRTEKVNAFFAINQNI